MGFKPISASLKDNYLFRYIFLRTFQPIKEAKKKNLSQKKKKKEAKIKPNWANLAEKKPTGLDLPLGCNSFYTGFQACKFENPSSA